MFYLLSYVYNRDLRGDVKRIAKFFLFFYDASDRFGGRAIVATTCALLATDGGGYVHDSLRVCHLRKDDASCPARCE